VVASLQKIKPAQGKLPQDGALIDGVAARKRRRFYWIGMTSVNWMKLAFTPTRGHCGSPLPFGSPVRMKFAT
jgi:hypothetical protein